MRPSSRKGPHGMNHTHAHDTHWHQRMVQIHGAPHRAGARQLYVPGSSSVSGSGEAIDPSPRSTTSSCASIECFLSAPCRTEPAARGGWGDGVRAVSNAGGEEVASSRPHAA